MKKITLLLLLSTLILGCRKKVEMLPSFSLDKGLVAYYPLDGNFQDKTSYSNHGVSSALPTEDRKGTASMAYDFVRNEFQSYNIPINLKNNYTFSFWIKMNVYEDGMAVMEFAKNKQCNKNPQIWEFQDSLFLTPTTESNNRIYIQSLRRIKGGGMPTWNHVLWTVSGDSTRMYVNNVLIQTKAVSWPDLTNVDLTLGNAGNTCTGDHGASNYHNQPSKVSIDEVRVYNRVLSRYEIEKLSLN